MPRRDVSFTIALSTSLIAHGTLGLLVVNAYAEREAYRLAAFDRPMWVNLDGESLLPIGLWDAALPADAELPPDAPASPLASIHEPPPPPLSAQPTPPPLTPEFRPPMGDDLGGGQAIGRLDGDRPQQARQADQDQPALTREAPGLPEPSLASNPSTPSPASPATPTAQPAPTPEPPEPTKTAPTPDHAGAEGFLRNATGQVLPDREDPAAAPQQPAPPPPRLGADQGSPLPPVPENPRPRRPVPTPDHTPPSPNSPDAPAAGTAHQPRPDNARPAETLRDTPGTTDTPTPTAASPQTPDKSADDRPIGPADQPHTEPAPPPSPTTPPLPPGTGLPQQPPPSPPTPDPSRLPPPAPQPTAPDPAPAPPLPQGTDAPEARPDGVQSPPTAPPPDDHPALPPPAPGAASNTPPSAPQSPPAASAANPQFPASPSPPSPAAAAVPPGEPRTRSDRDADPFSRVGSIAFTPGRVDARLGRQVRWVRPRLTMAGQLDAASTRNSAVGMAVTIDPTGRVTHVRVLESSGFPDTIDLPVVRAVYSWWFEPLKNAAGEPQPDTLLIRVVIRN